MAAVLSVVLVAALTFCACSDDDDDDEVDPEWADWQTKNDNYWDNIFVLAQQNIANGDSTWKILRSWTLVNQRSATTGDSLTDYGQTNYIVVHVVNKGEGTTSPLLTDSVRIHYLGRLIPSPTYTSGLIFSYSYNYADGYNLRTMRPYTAICNSFITGFTTALLNMHDGDRWTVYVPYNLAYGSGSPGTSTTFGSGGARVTTSTSSSSAGIQPYSNLIFDITLVDFHHSGETVPTTY